MAEKREPTEGKKTEKSKEKKRKGGGGKLSRSEVVTVRLDAKLKFGAELASRKHRRTLSSFIEWAVEKAIEETKIVREGEIFLTADEVTQKVWDVDEVKRFIKLAHFCPNLLAHDEETLWELITGYQRFWNLDADGKPSENDIRQNAGFVNFGLLNIVFETFKKVVEGKLAKSELASDLRNTKDAYLDSLNDIPF